MLMGYREYARHRGCSLGAVQKAVRDKRITATDEKKIDADLADKAWQNNTDASRVAVNALEHRAPPMQLEISVSAPPAGRGSTGDGELDDAPESDEVTGSDRVANEYREHRSTRERYQALSKQLEYEQRAGQLISVDEAKRIVGTSFRALRDSVMNVATRIKDQLAAETDPHVCETLVESEISAALAGIDIGKLLSEQDE